MAKKTIFKIHNRDKGFTQIDNDIIDNEELSWKAKGLLVYLLSKPDDWKIYIKNLSQASKDGKTSTSSALKELIKQEHVFKGKIREEDGKFRGYKYDVYEKPPREQEILPKSGNPFSDNPKNGQSPTTNIDTNKKESTKGRSTDRSSNKYPKKDYKKATDAYKDISGSNPKGSEWKPIQQAIKTMFMNERTPEQIIAFMRDLEASDKEWTNSWTIHTVRKKMHEYLADNLGLKGRNKLDNWKTMS